VEAMFPPEQTVWDYFFEVSWNHIIC
jgi:hypothetical protein